MVKGGSVSRLWLGWYSRALSATGGGYEARGLQRSLSADYDFFVERSKALICFHPAVTGLAIEQWLGERGALFSWLGLYCQEGV